MSDVLGQQWKQEGLFPTPARVSSAWSTRKRALLRVAADRAVETKFVDDPDEMMPTTAPADAPGKDMLASGFWLNPARGLLPSRKNEAQGVLFYDRDDPPVGYAQRFRDSGINAHDLPALAEEARRRSKDNRVTASLVSAVDTYGEPYHEVSLEHPRKGRLATLSWHGEDGHIGWVDNQTEGHGLAALMLDSARRIGQTTPGIPMPQHDWIRSDEGVVWSRKQMARHGEEVW